MAVDIAHDKTCVRPFSDRRLCHSFRSSFEGLAREKVVALLIDEPKGRFSVTQPLTAIHSLSLPGRISTGPATSLRLDTAAQSIPACDSTPKSNYCLATLPSLHESCQIRKNTACRTPFLSQTPHYDSNFKNRRLLWQVNHIQRLLREDEFNGHRSIANAPLSCHETTRKTRIRQSAFSNPVIC